MYDIGSYYARFPIHHVFFQVTINEQGSINNVFTWLNRVYDDSSLPCSCKVKSSNGTFNINGTYHHLTAEQADIFTKILVDKLEEFTVCCIQAKASGGALLRSSASGKGQLSLTPQKVGPLRD